MVYCHKCGKGYPDEQINCLECGTPLVSTERPKRPDNYLAWSIITTIMCCLIGGIVAIVNSAKVDSLYNAGDYEGANEASEAAKSWNAGSMVISGIFFFIYFLIMLFLSHPG